MARFQGPSAGQLPSAGVPHGRLHVRPVPSYAPALGAVHLEDEYGLRSVAVEWAARKTNGQGWGLGCGRDIALPGELCGLRDELHRLSAEVAEDVATVERYREMARWLNDVSLRLHGEGRRLAKRRGAPEL